MKEQASLQRQSEEESLSCQGWRARFPRGAALFMGGPPIKAMGPSVEGFA